MVDGVSHPMAPFGSHATALPTTAASNSKTSLPGMTHALHAPAIARPETAETTPTTVIVGWDASVYSKQALHEAFAKVLQPHDHLIVVAVLQRPVPEMSGVAYYVGPFNLSREEHAMQDRAVEQVKTQIYELLDGKEPTNPITLKLKWGNDPAKIILDVAKSLDPPPSMIVVGSHGRGALKTLLLGSVSNYLVHHSEIPVLVVRKPKDSKLSPLKGSSSNVTSHAATAVEPHVQMSEKIVL